MSGTNQGRFSWKENLGKEKDIQSLYWGRECFGEAEKSMTENQTMGLNSCVVTGGINWC